MTDDWRKRKFPLGARVRIVHMPGALTENGKAGRVVGYGVQSATVRVVLDGGRTVDNYSTNFLERVDADG
jgi:hypothetical protein